MKNQNLMSWMKSVSERKEQNGKIRVLQSLEQGNQKQEREGKQKRNEQRRNEQRRNNGQGGNNLLFPTVIASNDYHIPNN